MNSCNQQQKAAWSFGLQSFIPCHQGNVGRPNGQQNNCPTRSWHFLMRETQAPIIENLTQSNKIYLTCSTPTVSPTFLLPLLRNLVVSWIFSFLGFWPGTVNLAAHDTRVQLPKGVNQLSEVLLESASRTLAGATGESGHSRTRGAGAWAVAPEISIDWTWCQTNRRHSCPGLWYTMSLCFPGFHFFVVSFLKRSFFSKFIKRGVGLEEKKRW